MAEEKEKPLTREDVVRLIEERGGTAEGLNLSRRPFKRGIDLSGLDLQGITLHHTGLLYAKFNGSELRNANFSHSTVEYAEFNGSNLWNANFSHCNLQYAKFNPLNSKPADLMYADLRGASLLGAQFRDANLSTARFGVKREESPLGTHLNKTDLRGATLSCVDFEECSFYGTKLEGAFICGVDI